jgi:hypothetical protein
MPITPILLSKKYAPEGYSCTDIFLSYALVVLVYRLSPANNMSFEKRPFCEQRYIGTANSTRASKAGNRMKSETLDETLVF